MSKPLVVDADGHVVEPNEIFADRYWPAELAYQRPKVVPIDGDLRWYVDGQVIPKLSGPGSHPLPSPASLGDTIRPSAARRAHIDPVDSAELRTVDARLRQLDKEGIDLQIIYPSLFLAHPLNSVPTIGTAMARAYNSWLHDSTQEAADRLKWVAVISPDDMPGTLAELERCKNLGAVGVMILGTVGNRTWNKPEFEPFWALVEELDLPVAVHVGWSSPALTEFADDPHFSTHTAVIWPVWAAFIAILAHGVLDRHPRVRVAFLEAGGQWIPWHVDKLEEAHEQQQGRAAVFGAPHYPAQHGPMAYIRRGQVYFGFEPQEAILPAVLKQVGDDRFMYASDIPHGDRIPGLIEVLLGREDLTDPQKVKLLGENALRFYKLGARVPTSSPA